MSMLGDFQTMVANIERRNSGLFFEQHGKSFEFVVVRTDLAYQRYLVEVLKQKSPETYYQTLMHFKVDTNFKQELNSYDLTIWGSNKPKPWNKPNHLLEQFLKTKTIAPTGHRNQFTLGQFYSLENYEQMQRGNFSARVGSDSILYGAEDTPEFQEEQLSKKKEHDEMWEKIRLKWNEEEKEVAAEKAVKYAAANRCEYRIFFFVGAQYHNIPFHSEEDLNTVCRMIVPNYKPKPLHWKRLVIYTGSDERFKIPIGTVKYIPDEPPDEELRFLQLLQKQRLLRRPI
jgi:hypothetical protein